MEVMSDSGVLLAPAGPGGVQLHDEESWLVATMEDELQGIPEPDTRILSFEFSETSSVDAAEESGAPFLPNVQVLVS